MAITVRDNSTATSNGSGAGVNILDNLQLAGIKEGDLIVIFGATGSSSCSPTAIEDDSSAGGNSYTAVELSNALGLTWYAIAKEDKATLTVTVTFGDDTAWARRGAHAVAFNPGDGSWKDQGAGNYVAAEDCAAYLYTTSRTTAQLSATEDNVVAVAHYTNNNNRTIEDRQIAGAAPGTTQTAEASYYGQWWSIFESGVTNKTAYLEIATIGNIQLQMILFEVEEGDEGGKIPVDILLGMGAFNGGFIDG